LKIAPTKYGVLVPVKVIQSNQRQDPDNLLQSNSGQRGKNATKAQGCALLNTLATVGSRSLLGFLSDVTQHLTVVPSISRFVVEVTDAIARCKSRRVPAS
jgi:hypothetical protein